MAYANQASAPRSLPDTHKLVASAEYLPAGGPPQSDSQCRVRTDAAPVVVRPRERRLGAAIDNLHAHDVFNACISELRDRTHMPLRRPGSRQLHAQLVDDA